MGYDTHTTWPGVLAHHADDCPKRDGGRCTCGVTGYRASVYDPLQEQPVLGPIFPTVNEADRWRREQQAATDAWHAVTGARDTVGDVIDEFLEGLDAGRAVDERGVPRPPEELSELRWALRALQGVETSDGRGLLGDLPVAQLDAAELRALVDRLDAAGLSHRRTHSVIGALRALLRFAANRGLVPPSAAEYLVFGGPEPAPAPAPEPAPTGMAAIIAGPPGEAGLQPPRATVQATMPPTMPGTVPPTTPGAIPGTVASPNGHASTPAARAAHAVTTITAPAARQLHGQAPQGAPGSVPDEVIWLVLKVVAIVFALIALVLVAESV
jgi:hypothetical protein